MSILWRVVRLFRYTVTDFQLVHYQAGLSQCSYGDGVFFCISKGVLSFLLSTRGFQLHQTALYEAGALWCITETLLAGPS